MLPYLIPLIFSIFCAIRYDINNRRDTGKLFGYIFLFVYLTLLIGLRYRVGGDSLTYEAVYSHENDLSTWHFNLLHIYQPGFTFLFAVAKSISKDFVSFQILHILIVNTLLFIFLWNNTKYRFLALCIIEYAIYLYFTTEILRETLAVLIFVLNYPNYQNKRWIRFYIGVAICMLFHISACFLILLPLFQSLRFNKSFLCLCFVIVFFVPVIIRFIGSLGIEIISEKANNYGEQFYGYLATFRYVLSGGLFPFFILWLFKRNGIKLKFENLICIQTMFGLAAISSPLIFGRFVNYFILFLIIDLSYFFHNSFRSNNYISRRNSYVVIFLLLVSYSPQYLYLRKYVRYIPYSSIFNPIIVNRDYNIEID